MNIFQKLILLPFAIIIFLPAVSLCTSGFDGKGEPLLCPIYDVTQNCLIGAWTDSGWMIYDSTAALMRGGEKYEFYSMFKPYVSTNGGKPKNSEMGACPEIFNIEFNGCANSKEHIVAFSGDWDALPRKPKSVKPGNRTKKIVQEYLKKNGIPKTKIKVKQVLIVDLEGKSQYDTIITATYYKGEFYFPPKPGDYSVVLMQRLIDGESITIPVIADIHAEGNEESLMYENTVYGFFDFNNDGRLEILLGEDYYEGSFSVLMEILNNTPVHALDCGCGL